MHRELARYIEEKRVEADLRERLAALSSADEEGLLALIAALNPSANTLRGYLRLIDEIVRRDRAAPAQLLALPEITAVLSNDRLSRKEKQKKVRLELEARRFPQMQRYRAQAANLQRLILERHGVKVEMPEQFEGDSLSITAAVRSPAELQSYAAQLDALASSPELAELYRLLKGETDV